MRWRRTLMLLTALALAGASGSALAAGKVKASTLFSKMTSSYRLEFTVAVYPKEKDSPRQLVSSGNRDIYPVIQRIREECLRKAKVSIVYDLTGTYLARPTDRDLDQVEIDPATPEEVADLAQRYLTCAAVGIEDLQKGLADPAGYGYPRVLLTGPGRKPVASNIAKWRNWLEAEITLKAGGVP